MLLLYSISFVTISISSGASALWTHPTPTKNSDNEQSTNRWTPKPTNPPILNPRQSTSAACGVLHGNPSVSDYSFTCPTSQTCLWGESWWGCCFQTPTYDCYVPVCPSYSSCIGSDQIHSCNSNCTLDPNILKCTDAPKTQCAIANAISMDNIDGFGPDSTYSVISTGLQQFACASSQFILNFSVTASSDVPAPCAPPWAANPSSLSAAQSSWSEYTATHITNPYPFGNPFDQLVTKEIITVSSPAFNVSAQSSSSSTEPASMTTTPTTSNIASITSFKTINLYIVMLMHILVAALC